MQSLPEKNDTTFIYLHVLTSYQCLLPNRPFPSLLPQGSESPLQIPEEEFNTLGGGFQGFVSCVYSLNLSGSPGISMNTYEIM